MTLREEICDLTEKEINEISATAKRLDVLSKEYVVCEHYPDLEILKRKMNAELAYFAVGYAKVRAYKAGTHVYCEEARKRIKAEAIDDLIKTKNLSYASASNQVYSHSYYVDRLKIIEGLKKRFIAVETSYDHYVKTLDCVIQSISVSVKEMTQTKNS